jgi:hypothetical protein
MDLKSKRFLKGFAFSARDCWTKMGKSTSLACRTFVFCMKAKFPEEGLLNLVLK